MRTEALASNPLDGTGNMLTRLLANPIEGGLSEVEERALREVAIGAGASKGVVWVGHELSDAEVRDKLGDK